MPSLTLRITVDDQAIVANCDGYTTAPAETMAGMACELSSLILEAAQSAAADTELHAAQATNDLALERYGRAERELRSAAITARRALKYTRFMAAVDALEAQYRNRWIG